MSQLTRDEQRRGRGEVPAHILDAARRNFLRFGVNRATMADIARSVGMPRQTLYEYVSSRDDIIDAVLVERIREIADGIRPPRDGSFAESFVELSGAAIHAARHDAELMNIVTTGPMERVQEVVTGAYREVHDVVRDLLGGILDQGERAGQLRTDKSRDEIIDWIRIFYLAVISQPAIDEAKVRGLVADFLLPSIMNAPRGS